MVLVGRGDDILFQRAYGSRRLLEPRPMTLDTIFDIASLTKPVGTTLAVMSLVERGAVKLDAPLGRYLKEFRGKQFDEVTIQRLLTHSAGLPAIPAAGHRRSGFPTRRAPRQLPLDYPPGSGFQYSDIGFILLGEVVRRVSGQPLDRYLERRLFAARAARTPCFNPSPKLRRVAPTEFADGTCCGEVHDPRARLLGGVAGHAGHVLDGRRSRPDLPDAAGRGTLDGQRDLKARHGARDVARSEDGSGSRALGWDISSAFSRTIAPFFPEGSVGHLGLHGHRDLDRSATGVTSSS